MSSSADGNAILVRDLTKRYGSTNALAGVDLAVPRGSIYGFLGPNGAGKTTTIRVLLGFIRATSGEARIFGHDCWRDGVAARSDLGYLVGADALYTEMSGTALLDFATSLTGRPPVLRQRLLDALELGQEALKRRLGSYSKGMRQKLALVAAMQSAPSLLILDEPSDGLDPLIQRNFEETLREMRHGGATVFMSSHDLPEVERLCERVAIVRGGRVLAEETIADLARHHRRQATVVFSGPPPSGLDTAPGVTVLGVEDRTVTLSVEGEIAPLLRALAPHDVADLLLPPPRLEDIFLGFYGQTAETGR